MDPKKSTTGTNDRPKDAPIGQTGEGIPDDTSSPVEVDEAEIKRTREKLVSDDDGGKEAEGHPS